MFEKIKECHTAVGHSGRDKTWAEVSKYFAKNSLKNSNFY